MTRRHFIRTTALAVPGLYLPREAQGIAMLPAVIAGGALIFGGWATWQLYKCAKRWLNPPPPLPQPPPGQPVPTNGPPARIPRFTNPPLHMSSVEDENWDIYNPKTPQLLPSGEPARIYISTRFESRLMEDEAATWTDEGTLALWMGNDSSLFSFRGQVQQTNRGLLTEPPFLYLVGVDRGDKRHYRMVAP